MTSESKPLPCAASFECVSRGRAVLDPNSAAAIQRRIARVNGATWSTALLFVDRHGFWWVGRDGVQSDETKVRQYTRRGLLVGAYTQEVGLDQLIEDVEEHIYALRRT